MKIAIITGASTGIGFDACHRLARIGYQILACVRNPDESLRQTLPQGTWLVRLDVCNPQHFENIIHDFHEKFEQASSVSLINNAGQALPGPLEALPLQEIKNLFEVNVFGLLAASQCFLPYIRKTQGRIINIGSISGLHSSPYLGAYCATKYAVEAISDAQRRELSPFGVKVVCIEPGSIKTPIWDKGLQQKDKIMQKLLPDRLPVYQKNLERFIRAAEKISQDALPVSRVSDVIEKSMTSDSPATKILIVKFPTWIQIMMFRYLPEKWMDALVSKALSIR